MPLRVLFVTNLWPDPERPWHGTFVKVQADSLRSLGVDVDVMPIRGYADRMEYARACWAALKLNRRRRYDVVHAHYGYSAVAGRLQLRAPLVISYHGSDLMGKPTPTGPPTAVSRIEVAAFRQLARVASATITMSARMERVLPAATRTRNSIIPTGVDLETFAPRSRADARRRLGWPDEEKSVLWVGNFRRPLKNFALAERIVERLTDSVPEARLRVAWELDPEDIPLWLAASDALLMTSRSEGSPTVIKEAMATELPIVSTDVGDVRERVESLPGCWVGPGEVEAMSRAVEAALAHGPCPEARIAIAPLGVQETARRVLNVYEGVAKAHGEA